MLFDVKYVFVIIFPVTKIMQWQNIQKGKVAWYMRKGFWFSDADILRYDAEPFDVRHSSGKIHRTMSIL